MSLSVNAEESDANQSKFYRVISSKPVTNAEALFDTLSKFLTKDKKRQIAMDFLDDKDLLSSRLMWNNLRNVANCVIEEGCSHRTPIPAWVEQKDAIVVDETNEEPTGDVDVKEEPESTPQQETDAVTESPQAVESPESDAEEDTKAASKKKKKEAKEARKRERAEKRKAKEARKEERAAKRLRKEAKKRKKEE